MADGKVIIEIDADSEGFESKLDNIKKKSTDAATSMGKKTAATQADTQATSANTEATEQNTNAIKKSEVALKGAGKHISEVGEKMSKIGTSMTKYVTTPVLAAGVAAVKFASDYEENLNKVDASFKNSAQVVKDWAKTATEQFGMSESAALEATSLFGDMGTSMGLTADKAASMSTNLAGLAGDLASFKNIGIDQAMTALKGVFTGETESLKELGVVMTETNLKEFAKGLGLVYDEMNQTERVTLRYQYVLANTKNAQGDYARTADGTANSMRTLKSSVENLGAAFGQELLPEITPVIQDATTLIKRFGDLDESTKQSVIHIGLMAAAAGPATAGLGKVSSGIGKVVETAGALRSEMAGGKGLGSAMVSTLSVSGTAGLAIAGLAGITAGAIAVGEAIYNATDPMAQMKKHLENIGDSQERIAKSDNITELCTRYEELRAKTADTSLSAEELAAVQAELDEVRAALSEATNGAISVEGAYTAALDKTVQAQKELAGVEKERSNQEIYTELVAGAKEYHKALEQQEKKKQEIAKAEEQVTHYTDQMTEATAKATSEMEKNGKISFTTSLAMDDAATCAGGATKKYNELRGGLEELEAATAEYENSMVDLVRNGFLESEDACALLGISQEGLRRKIQAAEQQELSAAKATNNLAEEHLEAAEAAQEQADAEAEAHKELGKIGAAAYQAMSSGEDLRAKYEELKKQMDDLGESGDAETRMLAEQALATLNLAATNQELSETYPGIVSAADAAGYSITNLSTWLIENGLTADEWGGRVQDAASGVMNGFQELDTSLDMSLSEMAANLESNITAYSSWNANIQTLMAEAVSRGDQAAVDFVNYMQQMGIGAATQVQAMVDNIGWTMDTFPPLMAQATQDGMVSVYNEVEGGKINAAEAASGVMDGVAEALTNTDLRGPTSTAMSTIPAAITAQAPAVQEATTSLAMTAHSAMAQVGWADLGSAIGTGISNGITAQSGTIQSAAGTLADATVTAWNSYSSKFQQTGTAAANMLRTGLTAQKSSVTSAGRSLAEGVTSAWAQSSARFQSAGTAASAAIAGGISSGSGGITSAASSAAYSAYGAVGGLGWYGLGYNISAGIASGVRGGSGLITSAARAAASAALSSAKASLGIHSPSRVFRDDVGRQIPAGIALGIEAATPKAEHAVELSAEQLLRATQIALRPSGDLAPAQNIVTNNAYYGGGSGDGVLKAEAPVIIQLNDREVGRGVAKFTGQRMAYLGGLS